MRLGLARRCWPNKIVRKTRPSLELQAAEQSHRLLILGCMDRNLTTCSRLLLELKAQSETLEAIVDAAQAGADAIVLEAIASDPIPVDALPGLEATIEETAS